ncbi:MAG: DUF1330 domain-containing protein [Stellaceae bacterium]
MAAYFIAHRREIKDSKTLKSYDGVDQTLQPYGGKVLVRADEFAVLEGDWHPGVRKGVDTEPGRITVIAFPDMASLRRWYDGPEYAGLKRVRLDSASADAVAVETA